MSMQSSQMRQMAHLQGDLDEPQNDLSFPLLLRFTVPAAMEV